MNNLENAILNLTMTNIRTVGGLDGPGRASLHARQDQPPAPNVVDDATSPWGIKVTRIEIRTSPPPRDLGNPWARQMKAERDKRAAILEGRGPAPGAILKAEGAKQSSILSAEGDRQSTILQAEGPGEAAFRAAEARERSAEAEAKATAMVSEAIAKGDVQAINYFLGVKYVEVPAAGSVGTEPEADHDAAGGL